MPTTDYAAVSARLAAAGCVACDEEAAELIAAAGPDQDKLEDFLRRRTGGEPTAWITGSVTFCGSLVAAHAGVYVPRWQTERLAERAAELLPEKGAAIDACTGSGAIPVVLRARRPAARVVGTDIDPRAVACARANGVEAYEGDLTAPVPAGLRGRVDVVTAVAPYVPSEAIHLLPRDVRAFEPAAALDGGPGGTRHLRRVAGEALGWLRPGGVLLLELGGDQGQEMASWCEELGYCRRVLLEDDDGDLRGIEAHVT